MINKLILCLTLSLVLIIFIHANNTEFFYDTDFMNDSLDHTGNHSVVNISGGNAYDLDLIGPTCLSTCIMEHVPNINWQNPHNTDNLLKYNIDNPNKGYCYRANDDNFPFKCDTNDCKEKCGKSNPPDTYDYDMDFLQCEISDSLGCVEKKLNIDTGHALQTTVGCKSCISKYKPNIDTLLHIYEEEDRINSRCNANI